MALQIHSSHGDHAGLNATAPRPRIPHGSLSQLVSRFEMLDAMSTVDGGARDVPLSPGVSNKTDSRAESAHRNQQTSSFGSLSHAWKGMRETSKTGSSSQVSPGHVPSPNRPLPTASPPSPQLRTLQPIPEPTLEKTSEINTRQPSMAERRRLFEYGPSSSSSTP